jgi:hypothetical protein
LNDARNVLRPQTPAHINQSQSQGQREGGQEGFPAGQGLGAAGGSAAAADDLEVLGEAELPRAAICQPASSSRVSAWAGSASSRRRPAPVVGAILGDPGCYLIAAGLVIVVGLPSAVDAHSGEGNRLTGSELGGEPWL